ncbi:LIM zinc-binding domain-containing protein, partial [Trichostrongylus colubriformis]
MGSKLYIKQDLMMCETDYRRLYGYRGICTGCRQVIPPYDMVMRVKNNLYHLKCFRCSVCSE